MNKLFSHLLLFSLFGIAMWFFGNLYEAIVIGPNMLENSGQRLHYWQNFFVVINPVFFYVPIPPLAAVSLIVLFFIVPKEEVKIKKQLKLANIFQITSLALSTYIITQLNFKLFFGDLEKYADQIPSRALLWNILNLLRVALIAIALRFVFNAYMHRASTTILPDVTIGEKNFLLNILNKRKKRQVSMLIGKIYGAKN